MGFYVYIYLTQEDINCYILQGLFFNKFNLFIKNISMQVKLK